MLFKKNNIHVFIDSTIIFLFVFSNLIGGVGFYIDSNFITFDKNFILVLNIFSLSVFSYYLISFKDLSLKLLLPFFLFFTISIISVFFSEYFSLSLKRLILILGDGAVIVILMTSYRDPKKVLRILGYVLLGVCAISLIWSMIVFVFGHWIEAEQGRSIRSIDIFDVRYGYSFGLRDIGFLNLMWERPAGITSNPNSLSVYGVVIIFLSIIFKEEYKKFFVLCLFVSVIITFITFSRGQMLFVIFSFIYFLGARRGPVWMRMGCLSFAGLLPILLAVAVIWNSSSSYNLSFLSVDRVLGEEVFSMNERALSWQVVLSEALKYPFWGRGFGIVQESVLEPAGLVSSAYSVPFSILSELGILGLICFYCFWFWPLIRVSLAKEAVPREHAVIGALLLGLFVHQCFDSSVLRYHPFNSLFFVFYGLLLNPWLAEESSEPNLVAREADVGRV